MLEVLEKVGGDGRELSETLTTVRGVSAFRPILIHQVPIGDTHDINQ